MFQKYWLKAFRFTQTISEKLIQLFGNNINGPRIGLCAPNIELNSTVLNASEKGCPAGLGFGKGS